MRIHPVLGKLSRRRTHATLPRHRQSGQGCRLCPRCRSGTGLAHLSRLDRARVYGNGSVNESRQKDPAALNHLDNLVHDWGWWNRGYTRLLIRSRGYRLVSMPKVLPSVETVSELTRHENGALFWLEPRPSLHHLQPPP